MVEDKIQLQLQDLAKLQAKLKEIKHDIKVDETIEDNRYEELKGTYKQMKKQMKDFEEEYLQDLKKDNSYNQLRELKVKTEEELALAREKLFENIAKLPQKHMQMNVDTEGGMVKITIQPEMRLYLNGKEQLRAHRGL